MGRCTGSRGQRSAVPGALAAPLEGVPGMPESTALTFPETPAVEGGTTGIAGVAGAVPVTTGGATLGDTIGVMLGDTIGDTLGDMMGDTLGDTIGVTLGDTIGATVEEPALAPALAAPPEVAPVPELIAVDPAGTTSVPFMGARNPPEPGRTIPVPVAVAPAGGAAADPAAVP